MKKIFLTLCCIILIAVVSVSACACSRVDTDTDVLQNVPKYSVYREEDFVSEAARPKDGGVKLIENGATEYRIVYSATDDTDILTAIADMRSVFAEVCSGIQAVTDDVAPQQKEIVIGNTNRGFFPRAALQKVGAYVIASDNGKIYIYAVNEFGITNGIYGFLEDYLGVMFLDKDSTYVPPLGDVILAIDYDVQEPAFDRRDVGDSQERYMRNKLRVRNDETFEPNACHYSLSLLDPNVLAKHPEYYAELGGKRRTGDYMFQATQLCFSNPDVVDLLEEATVERADNYDGEVTVWWDISQQDSMNYCTCSECRRLTELYGNPAAPIYVCVNTIAKRHPELRVSTLAYHYGSTPPVNMQFEPNVMIKWCLMSTLGQNDYSAPISEQRSQIAAKQYNEILGWSQLTKNIYVWDYITNYFFYLSPFPCLDAMEGNIKLLRDCGVAGVFSLSAYNQRCAWDRLKANYAAHLLWNPDMDAKAFISKFVTVYFGRESAPYILEIYEKMQNNIEGVLWVYDMPTAHQKDFLSEANIEEYFALLQKAFDAAGTNETYLKRLRFEKAPLLQTAILLNYGTKETQAERKAEFAAICEEFGMYYLNETATLNVDDIVY